MNSRCPPPSTSVRFEVEWAGPGGVVALAGWYNAASGRGNSAGGSEVTWRGTRWVHRSGPMVQRGWASPNGKLVPKWSSNWRRGLFVGLTAVAILLTLGSLMSRPDSEEEFLEGRVMDLAIVAPIWAAVTFVNSRCRGGSNLRASILAAVTYILLASLLLALNNAKHSMRNAAWDGPGKASSSASPGCAVGLPHGAVLRTVPAGAHGELEDGRVR